MKLKIYKVVQCLIMVVAPIITHAGEFPKVLLVFKGTTPTLDGILSPGEYSDATVFSGPSDWTHEQTTPSIAADLSLTGYAKHDGENLYFSFDVTDDVMYAYDIDRWLPDAYPNANVLDQTGFPWFGDAIELMINASNSWSSSKSLVKGDGSGWMMVCNTHKSRLNSLTAGGLMEGEPRSTNSIFNRYKSWITNGDMEAIVRIKNTATEGHGYIIEWKIKPNPCLEIEPGVFWDGDMPRVEMGLNFELEDLDVKETGAGNFANFHHIEYWAAKKGDKSYPSQWGKMILFNSVIANVEESLISISTIKNYPNPVKDHTTFEFYTKSPGKANLSVYDNFGRKVDAPINNEFFNNGTNSVTWYAKNLAPGLYTYRFESNGRSIVQKLLVE